MTDASHWNDHYTSGGYLGAWDYKYPTPELIAIAASGLIPAAGAALDVGCGAGRDAVFLAQCGYCVIGVDCSPDGLAIAQARAEEAKVVVDWRCADVLALPVENLSVDFANDRGCFHVIADEDRPVYAREIARVMKPGGCFLLRGCRNVKDLPFNAITEEVVDKFFSEYFSRGMVLPIRLVSDAGTLEANVVVMKRKFIP